MPRRKRSGIAQAFANFGDAAGRLGVGLLASEQNKAMQQQAEEAALRRQLASMGITVPEGSIDLNDIAEQVQQARAAEAQQESVGEFVGADPAEQAGRFSAAAATGDPLSGLFARILEQTGSVPLQNRLTGPGSDDPENVGVAMADPQTGRITPDRVQSAAQPVPDLFSAPGSPFASREEFELDRDVRREGALAGARRAPELTPDQIQARSRAQRAGALDADEERGIGAFAPDEEDDADGLQQTLLTLAEEVLGDPNAPGSAEQLLTEGLGAGRVARGIPLIGSAFRGSPLANPEIDTTLTGIEGIINNLGVMMFGGRGFSEGEREAMLRTFMPQGSDRDPVVRAKLARLRALVNAITGGNLGAATGILPEEVRQRGVEGGQRIGRFQVEFQ